MNKKTIFLCEHDHDEDFQTIAFEEKDSAIDFCKTKGSYHWVEITLYLAKGALKSDNQKPSFKCDCGVSIPDSKIEYINKCNEFGEDYCEGTANCICGKEYTWSKWGWCKDLDEAKENLILFARISTNKKNK